MPLIPSNNLSVKLVDDLLAFLKDLHDPEGYGFACSEEVHQEAYVLEHRLMLEMKG